MAITGAVGGVVYAEQTDAGVEHKIPLLASGGPNRIDVSAWIASGRWAASKPEILIIGGGCPRGALRTIRDVRAVDPAVTIMMVVGKTPDFQRLRISAARAGCDAAFAIDNGLRGADGFREAIRCRLLAPVPRVEIRSIAAKLGREGKHKALVAALMSLRAGYRHTTVQKQADWLGLDRSTLRRHFLAAGLGTASQWIRLGRFLYVSGLRESGHSLTEIAVRLDFSTSSGAAMVLKRPRFRIRDESEVVPQVVRADSGGSS